MYGSEKMYLSPKSKKRLKWTKAQIEGRKKRLQLAQVEEDKQS